jgi:prepilin-type N-terminal cleavage/methylation domain-containing protein
MVPATTSIGGGVGAGGYHAAMRRIPGFTLLELLAVLALAAILAVALSPIVGDLLTRGRQVSVNEQTIKIQEAINAWVAQQPTLAAAAAQFQPGPDGATLVPKDATAFATLVNQYFMTENDSLRVVDGHMVTAAMTAAGCYVDITWPQPYRSNYPRVNLYRPQ